MEVLGLGLYIIGVWGYHQGDLDRAFGDATSFTNTLAVANKTGYKGYNEQLSPRRISPVWLTKVTMGNAGLPIGKPTIKPPSLQF